MTAGVSIRPLVFEDKSTDGEQMRGLFHRVYGHSLSAAAWRWKYLSGPRDHALSLGAFLPEGRLVGHIGALVFRDSTGSRWAQVCDVMVDAAFRGGLGRDEVYPCLARELAHQLSCLVPQPLAYGFPGERPFRLGERLGLYRRLPGCRTWVRTCADAEGSFTGSRRLVAVPVGHWPREAIQQALQGVCGALATEAAWAWRYRQHPHFRYSLWRVSSPGDEWCSWLVVRWIGPQRLLVMDCALAHGHTPVSAVDALISALGEQYEVESWMPVAEGVSASTPFVATEFLLPNGPQDRLPTHGFQPGDTDVL